MGSARRRRDASPRAARSLTAMPEIDLPTVIFALVALFVAYKLRSVLGMRQDSGRQSGGLLAPLRRVPAPPTAPVVPTDTAAPAPPPATDRWKGVAEPDPAVWSGLDAIAAAGQTMTTTVVSIDDATIVGAQLVGAAAQLGVRFAAKLASVTRDAHGVVVDGSPSAVADHIDLWTFGRDIRSRDPNWMLTATESASGAAAQR